MFKIIQNNCGFHLEGGRKKAGKCARNENGSFDTDCTVPCTEDNCEVLKLLKDFKDPTDNVVWRVVSWLGILLLLTVVIRDCVL